MNIDLKDFQQINTLSLLGDLAEAQRERKNRGKTQALVLSAPTASGKTVMLSSLIECALGGDGGLTETIEYDANPNAVFLWLSDQPELNKQSRERIMTATARLRQQDLVLVDTDFHAEFFEGGKVYFINAQKLGKDKLLTRYGDGRQFTIWDTIRNTQERQPDAFFLIIDEAHRGMRVSEQERREAKSIVQQFLVGSEHIPPINIVIGLSATPAHFNEFLANTNRTVRKTDVDPADVRRSGLIKDEILLFAPEGDHPTDWTLLVAACHKHTLMTKEWQAFTNENGNEPVVPLLVVQIEDGPGLGGTLSKTNLNQLVATLTSELPGLREENIAHCLREGIDIHAAGWKIQHVDQSTIANQTDLHVVLFKMALTTGWDCPRAEVMMSFRSAQDATLIAQLVGRMVRTPLADRIRGNDILNQVFLYLPKYDRENLDKIIGDLTGDREAVPVTRVRRGVDSLTLRLATGMDDALAAINTLPTYQMKGTRKSTNLRRLIKLCRLLSQHAIAPDATNSVAGDLANRMSQYLDQRLKRDKALQEALDDLETVQCRVVTVQNGDVEISKERVTTIRVTPRDVETLFSRAKSRFTDEVAMAFWRLRHRQDEPLRAKVETFELSQDAALWRDVEQVAEAKIDDLFKGYRTGIANLPADKRAKYDDIAATAKQWEAATIVLGETIVVDAEKAAQQFKHHLFVDEHSQYSAELNKLEQQVIEEESQRSDLVAWLRNYDRKPWALSFPYDLESRPKPAYPDFLVVRRVNAHFAVDILEPHLGGDSLAKAKGMVWFWERHPRAFGRMEMIRKDGNRLVRLDFANPSLRNTVRDFTSLQEIDHLFDTEAKKQP